MRALIVAAAIGAIGACSEETTTAEQQPKGQYGASSGANPNLADLQNDLRTPNEVLEGAPSPESGAAAPPDAESGASTTGAGQDQAGDAHTEHQQQPTP